MSVIYVEKLESVKIPEPFERSIKVILAPDTQEVVKDLSITMGIIAPHSNNDYHYHEGTELLYIMSGFGIAKIDGVDYEIKTDSLIIAPPGKMHQQINESDETMKMLAIWTPPVTSKEVLDRAKEAAGIK